MLILKRKRNQKIMIDGGITIMVVELGCGFVRLGIDAPKETRVDREEVYESRKREEDNDTG